MTSPETVGVRRVAGFAGLLGAAALLVGVKAAGAPAPHRVNLAAPRSPAGSSAPPHRSGQTGSPGGSTRTVLGAPEDANYGTVQVRLTLAGSRIVDVTAVQLPSGGRSSEIAAYSAPQLRSEVLAAQSATIDTVSGASYTSDGYARSVQSALDAARS